MNKKYKLKGWVVFSVYAISIITIISSLYLVGKTLEGMIYSNESISYVYRGIIDDAVPVVSTTKNKKFIMPYQDENVKIIKNFYDKDSDNVTQENSLILYQNTYMPNTGILYGNDNVFDVVAVLDGTVESVTTDEVLGNILQHRSQEGLTTFFTSNLTIKDLEEHFGTTTKGIDRVKAKRIIERIKQLTTEMTLVSENKRKWGKKNEK